MKYEVIALDIDGTLLNNDQVVMPITREVLISLQKQGVRVVLASGRDLDSLQKIGKQICLEDYPQNGYICLNGLEIYDSSHYLLHQETKLSYKEAQELENIAYQYHIDMILFFDSQLFIIEYGHTHIIDHHFMTSTKDFVQSVKDIPSIYFQNLRKVAFVQRQEVFQNILFQLHQKTENHFELTLVEPDWIKINPLGLNKGSALETYAHIHHISLEKIIAFGNGENDISMLKKAGCGVAMGNAFERVKEIANDICEDHNHDGIGRYLLNI